MRMRSVALLLVAVFAASPDAPRADDDRPVPSFEPYAAIAEDFSPSWSPDGKRLVFAHRAGGDTTLAVLSIDGGPPTTLGGGHVDTQPDWSRDGSRIAFSSNRGGGTRLQIWTMKPDGTDPRQVTNLPGNPNVQPRWSPDGRRIAFVAYPGPRIMVVAADGGEPRTVASGVWPAWSPDGKRLAYGATSVFDSATRLAIKDLETGAELRPKSAPAASINQQPDWAPDGTRVAFVALVDGTAAIQIIDVANDRRESTTDIPASLFNPHWSPDGTRIAFMQTDTGHPPTIQIAKPDGTERRAITNAGVHAGAKAIAYRSADGLSIPSFLYEPERCRTAKCPAIVWLHGGLGGSFSNVFDRQVSYFVDQGFVVIAPNYRSSGGYGKELSEIDATGQKEMDDVAGAVEYLRRMPSVDGSHIGAVGLSFGGLIALATVTHRPETFAAAVEMFGPTDLLAWYRQTPHLRPTLRAGLGGTPDDRADAYRAASPVNFADRVRTPLLILHGDADTDVPVSQAHAMADALQRAHKDYELVIIPGGDHGFVMTGNVQAMEAAMRFMLAHLQRTPG